MSITADFFRNRLDQMIDLRHPLAVLANRMPWQEIEASLAHLFARQVRAGKKIEDSDLFGATEVIAGAGVSKAGRPRLPTRLMVSLLYLKHAFNESDEDLIQRWGETPTWQYFSGNEYFEHRWPCDPTQLVKFRKLLGEGGVEELLARTIEVAVTLKLIASKELSRIIVDSTVQEKAIAHPTDSKLLETARVKLVEAAKAEGIELKQSYAKEGQLLGYKAGRYAHARQFKRMRKAIKRQGTIVGRLHREISRKMTTLSQAVQEALGVKVGIATTLKGTLIVGARAFPGNPYDGHTLNEQVEQASILIQALGTKPQTAYVDLGYRGVDKDNLALDIKHRGKFNSLTDDEKQSLKRRQAIEPIIGHLKADHRMNRCHLKGSNGDSLHAVLCAAGFNIRWLLRMIAEKGISLFLGLLLSTGLGELGHRLRQIFVGPSVQSGAMNLALV
ncbi:transposase [Limnohabitans sp.]|uniref:transposase n=1 Tax=Limnohabitans sp. TaxID=1907725 RepID=UPI0025CF8C4B|nr:transposase [Limnohabitans sp.]